MRINPHIESFEHVQDHLNPGDDVDLTAVENAGENFKGIAAVCVIARTDGTLVLRNLASGTDATFRNLSAGDACWGNWSHVIDSGTTVTDFVACY